VFAASYGDNVAGISFIVVLLLCSAIWWSVAKRRQSWWWQHSRQRPRSHERWLSTNEPRADKPRVDRW
jgi:hypothetical protein